MIMPELTPRIFENIFFQHIKSLTAGHGADRKAPLPRPASTARGHDRLAAKMDSFDYQFSDRWIQPITR